MFKIDNDGNLLEVKYIHKNNTKIVVPNNVIRIGQTSFASQMIKEIVLPNSVQRIEKYAFFNCNNLVKITLPDSIKYIGESAFQDCHSLKEVIIPNGVESILPNTFYMCKLLKKVHIPESVKSIRNGAFNGCEWLEEVILPSSLEQISDYSFAKCQSLNKIVIPEGVETIGKKAFSNSLLLYVELPSTLETIEPEAFENCVLYNNLVLPNNLKRIGKRAFASSYSSRVKHLSIPETIEKLASDAFEKCYELRDFSFGDFAFSSVTNIEGLENLTHNDHFCVCDEILDKKVLDIISYRDGRMSGIDEITMSFLGQTTEMDCVTKSLIISTLFNKEDVIKMGIFANFLPYIAERIINKENYEEIKNSIRNNRKEFTRLVNKLNKEYSIEKYFNKEMYYDLFKVAYILGAFSDNQIERQKVSEFLSNILDKKLIDFDDLHATFESLNLRGYNKEYAEFLMDKRNFMELIKLENESSGYLSNIYNDFDKIKEFGRSNRGEQRYRKVTVDMCKEYYVKKSFEGINSTNMDISEVLKRYTNSQEHFEEVNKIRQEYLKLKESKILNDHIVGEAVKENDVFEQIEVEKENIVKNTKETLDILNELSNKRFTYEFLSKYDADNFVLGKYCFCCAHFCGAGFGIMKASILHPDCQNLIIRGEKGNIIAKSTLYINREQGYGVFNNVEISKYIIDDKQKDLIYAKYIQAINHFVEVYNKRNQSNPIKQINVGMNLNDLYYQLKKNNEKSEEILKGLDFVSFGGGWNGDWQKEQYVVYKK